MADTQPLAPTGAELWQLHMQMPGQHKDPIDFARAVLAKWGAQPVPASAAEFALRALVAAGHVTQERVDQALALSGAPAQPVVPAGYALVPAEPTPEMVDAAQEAYMPFGDMQLAIQLAIAAAPTPVAREPLTDEAARKLVFTASEWCRSEGISVEDAVEVVRATERAHGITKGAQHDPD